MITVPGEQPAYSYRLDDEINGKGFVVVDAATGALRVKSGVDIDRETQVLYYVLLH